jgi:hypothetical protein
MDIFEMDILDSSTRLRAPAEVFLPASNDPWTQAGLELPLSEEQLEALRVLHRTAEEGGIANLVGQYGSGKTILLHRLVHDLQDGTELCLISLGASIEDPFGLLKRRKLPGRRRRVTVLIDDWDSGIRDPGEKDWFRHWLERFLGTDRTAGRTYALIVASQRPLATLAEEDQVPLIPRPLLGRVTTVWLAYNWRLHRTRVADLAAAMPPPAPTEPLFKATRHWADDSTRRRLAEAVVRLLPGPQYGDPPPPALLAEEPALVRRRDDGTGIDIQPWLVAALTEAPPHKKGDDAALVDLVDFCLLAAAWQGFLTELSDGCTWLLDEMQAVGFDARQPDANLALYLVRVDQRPDQFAADLFRPSDLRRLFPEANRTLPKDAILKEALSGARDRRSSHG